MSGTGWIAAAGQIVGTVDRWEIVYTWDGTFAATHEAAIKSGLRHFGHDDFNVGQVRDGHLVW